MLLTDKLILKAAEKITLKEKRKKELKEFADSINNSKIHSVSINDMDKLIQNNSSETIFYSLKNNNVNVVNYLSIESVSLKDKITNTAKQVSQTVKNKVVHIWEVITKHKLKEFIVGKLIKKAMITQINHTTNTVTIKDMDNCNYYSIQGTDISEDVCPGTLISV